MNLITHKLYAAPVRFSPEAPALRGRGRFKSVPARVTTCLRVAVGLALLQGLGSAAPPTNAPAIADYSSFRIIADQNIFDPNRYPHAGRSRPRLVSRSAPGFSLVGTMSYQQGMIAFFDGTDSDYRKVLSLNGTIAGYRVEAITLSGVRLTSTNQSVELAVGGQLRQEGGQWQLASQGEAPISQAETDTPATGPSSAPASSGEPNDVLKKLMQQREQELK